MIQVWACLVFIGWFKDRLQGTSTSVVWCLQLMILRIRPGWLFSAFRECLKYISFKCMGFKVRAISDIDEFSIFVMRKEVSQSKPPFNLPLRKYHPDGTIEFDLLLCRRHKLAVRSRALCSELVQQLVEERGFYGFYTTLSSTGS